MILADRATPPSVARSTGITRHEPGVNKIPAATAPISRLRTDRNGRTRWLYAGPFRTANRAEASLEDSFADGDVSPAERPNVVRRGAYWWVEIDA